MVGSILERTISILETVVKDCFTTGKRIPLWQWTGARGAGFGWEGDSLHAEHRKDTRNEYNTPDCTTSCRSRKHEPRRPGSWHQRRTSRASISGIMQATSGCARAVVCSSRQIPHEASSHTAGRHLRRNIPQDWLLSRLVTVVSKQQQVVASVCAHRENNHPDATQG